MKKWKNVAVICAAFIVMGLSVSRTAECEYHKATEHMEAVQKDISAEMNEYNPRMHVKVMSVKYVDLIYRTTDGIQVIEKVTKGTPTLDGYGGIGGFDCDDFADFDRMACAIYKEAGGDDCGDDTRIMVGNVILNRRENELFPNSIEDVLMQYRQYNTFCWTGIVWPESAQSEPHAVERAYECAARVLEGTRLLPDDVLYQAEFPQGTETVVYQDRTYFCR